MAKQYGFPVEREHFRCCISAKALVNTIMIVGGRKESTRKDLKVDLGMKGWGKSEGSATLNFCRRDSGFSRFLA